MSKGVLGGLIAILVIVGLIFLILWLMCLRDLEDCNERVGQEDAGAVEGRAATPAFQLVLENDSFGTFQSVNNQIRGRPLSLPFYSGFFVQLGNFAGAQHRYQVVEFVFADDTRQTVSRGSFVWLDIACQPTPAGVITPAEAATFLPSTNQPHRRLHVDLSADALVTIWKGAGGLSVDSSAFTQSPPQGQAHGHDSFTFSSPDACEVRVWDDLAAANPATVHPATGSASVKEIRVKEITLPPQHGGPHSPPWG